MNNSHLPHIFIAEDDVPASSVMVDLLASFGYRTTAFANGLEMLAAMKTQVPNLILCDIRMPVMDGFQLLEKLQLQRMGRKIPFIFISAKADYADIRRGMELGADDYLIKPYQTTELRKAVEVRLQPTAQIADTLANHKRFLTETLPRDLKSPVASLLAIGESLKDMVADGRALSLSETDQFARGIMDSSDRLLHIAKSFMLWNRLAAIEVDGDLGRISPLSRCALSREKFLRTLRRSAAKFDREADLQLACPDEVAFLAATHDFEAVVAHLVENAFKFSPTGTPVRIEMQEDVGALQVTVVDKGRGMASEPIKRIKLFHQLRWTDTEEFGPGLGLGLIIAHSYARLSQGSLHMHSDGLGHGLKVTMRLPSSDDSAPAAAVESSGSDLLPAASDSAPSR